VCLCVVLVSSVCVQVVLLLGCYGVCGRHTGVAEVVEVWGGDPLCGSVRSMYVLGTLNVGRAFVM